jgi:hypothetical protein
MYSPKIKKEHVKALYQLKLIEKEPMTKLVNKAIEEYLQRKQASIIKEKINEYK